MNLDQMCAEALARLAVKTQERIDAFHRQCLRDAERTRRSMGQKWRHLRTELCRGH